MKFLVVVTSPSIYQIATSVIFLFKTLHINLAARGVSDTWTKYIICLRRYLWLIVTRIRKWNWIVFERTWLGGLNYKNPIKGDWDMLVGGGGGPMMETL